MFFFTLATIGYSATMAWLFRDDDYNVVLASHGYVVAAISHPYHALWTRDIDGRITFVNRDYFRAL